MPLEPAAQTGAAPGQASGASSRPRYFGAPVRPLETRRLLAGAGQYVADIRLPGMRQVAFVRGTHAHARISRTDPGAALSLPGVLEVLFSRQILEQLVPLRSQVSERVMSADNWLRPCDWSCLARAKVSFVGEIVAVVLADDRYLAEDGADLVRVEYEPLPVVSDLSSALQADSPRVRDEVPGNLLAYCAFEAGAVDEAFARASVLVSERFRTNRISASPLEGRGVVASYDRYRGELTVWLSCQIPFVVRRTFSESLGLPEERIRVIAPDVGGSFGTKAPVYAEELVVSLLAMRTGRPLCWIDDRREHLAAANHARGQQHEIELAADADGRILGLRGHYEVDVGAFSIFPQTGGLEAFQTYKLLPGPYHFPSYRSEARAVLTNRAPAGAFRAISRPVGNFVLESLLDQVGRALGLDPVEVRRRNLIQPEQFPYRTITGGLIENGSYVESLDLLARMVNLTEFRTQQRAARQAGRFLGVGFACYNEVAAQGSETINDARGQERMTGYDSAIVSIDASGHVSAALGVTTQGQSHETVFAQLLADEFAVELTDITIREGDTAVSPFGMGSGASRSAVVGGGALLLAARRLRARVLRIAAHLLEADVDDLELVDGSARVRGAPERALSLREIGRIADYHPTRLPPDTPAQLVERASYDPPAGTWSNGCHAAIVEVCPETG